MSFYAVVEFTEEEGDTAVVSSTWLRDNDKLCRWPSGPNCNLAKLAANHAKVDDRWTLHPCNVLKTYSTIENLSRRKRCRVTTNRKPVKPASPLRFSTTTSKTRSSSSSASSGFDMNHEIIGCPTNSLLNRPVPSLGSRQKIYTALEVEPPRLGLPIHSSEKESCRPKVILQSIKDNSIAFSKGNNCFMTFDNRVILVRRPLKDGNSNEYECVEYLSKQDIKEYPFTSSLLGIYYVRKPSVPFRLSIDPSSV